MGRADVYSQPEAPDPVLPVELVRGADLLLTNDGEEVFTSRRIDTMHTHGTGCTLASAVATGVGQSTS